MLKPKSLDAVIKSDPILRRASLRGCKTEMVALGIPQEKCTAYHHATLDYYCNRPSLLISDGVDMQTELTIYQRERVLGKITMEEYIIITECESMGDIK